MFFIACRGQTMHVASTNIQEEVYDFKYFQSDAMWYKSGHWNSNAGVGIVALGQKKKGNCNALELELKLFRNVAL